MKTKSKKIRKAIITILILLFSIYITATILINFLPEKIIGLKLKSYSSFYIPTYFRVNPIVQFNFNRFDNIQDIDGKGKSVEFIQDPIDSMKYSMRGELYVIQENGSNEFEINQKSFWIKNVYHIFKGSFCIRAIYPVTYGKDCMLQISSITSNYESNISLGPSMIINSAPDDSIVFYVNKKGFYKYIGGKGKCYYSNSGDITYQRYQGEVRFKYELPLPSFTKWNIMIDYPEAYLYSKIPFRIF